MIYLYIKTILFTVRKLLFPLTVTELTLKQLKNGKAPDEDMVSLSNISACSTVFMIVLF